MGTSQSSQLGSVPLTPAQQQQIWQQSQYQARQLTKELDALEQARYTDIKNITQLKQQVKQQLNALHPFNLATSTMDAPPVSGSTAGVGSSSSGPQPYGGPANQQTLATYQCSSTMNNGSCQQTLTAPNGSCKLVTQTDGNLVLYNTAGSPVWSSGTYGKGVAPYSFNLSTAGNLILTDSTGITLWSSGTSGKGKAPYTANMQDNCDFALMDGSSRMIWNTHTAGKQ